jgi:DNA invertase Pin-like site-specific DNA recombinase
MTQCIIYAAKSTTDDAGSIPSQIEECKAYAAARDWEVVAVESDEDKTAFRGSRGAGLVRAKEAAAAAARNGDAVLLAFTTDRFARGDAVEAAHLVEHVLEGLKSGYRVETAREDIGGEMALVLSALYGSRAHADSKAKSEHTKRGMAVSAAAGRVNGGPRRFGFEPARDGQLTPRPAEVEVARLIFELAREGKTQMDIARELNAAGYRREKGDAWTQPKVARVLRDRIWVGELVNPAGTFQIMEPLIPVELFEAVQRTLTKDGKRQGRRSKHFLLAGGLLRCGCCGYAMSVRRAETPAGLREHYRCTGRRSAAAECKQPDVPREPIDQAVLEYFTLVALDVEGTIEQLTGERDRRLAEIDAKLAQAHSVQADAERQLERLDGLLRDEGMTLDEWRRVAAVPASEAEAAGLAIDDLTAEREAVEATGDVADATGEFVERMTALRAAVAGEVNEADGILAAQTALRRVFDGFTLHHVEAPNAPRRVNAELHVGPTWSYVIDPRVDEAARLGTMPAGTPVVSRSPLQLGQGTRRLSPQGRNNRSGSRRGTAGGTARRRRTGRPRRSRS